MKKLLIFFPFIIFTSFLFSYENSLANLISPSGLHKGEGEFTIIHRFYGDITEEPFDTFLGIDAGANVGMKFRYQFIENIEANLEYQRRQKEKKIGISYRYELEDFPLNMQFEVKYFSYKELNQKDEKAYNFEYIYSIQYSDLFEKLTLTTNIGLDGYMKRFISGLAVDYHVVDNVALFFEYFPVFDRDSASDRVKQYLQKDDAFLFGLRLQTYGHKFIFTLSNTENIGLRRTSFGVKDNSIMKLGFNIQRKF